MMAEHCHPNQSVSYALIQLMKAHRSRAEVLFKAHGVHVGQEQVLFQLWDREGQTQTELAATLCIEPPTVTKMLQRMERSGLLERRTDASDARVQRVYLSEVGANLRGALDQAWDELERALMHTLTDAERMLLLRLIEQMTAGLTEP